MIIKGKVISTNVITHIADVQYQIYNSRQYFYAMIPLEDYKYADEVTIEIKKVEKNESK